MGVLAAEIDDWSRVLSATNRDLQADVEQGHYSAALCHLAEASYQVNRKLRVGAALMLAAAFGAYTRIALGKHYPSDVIGGAAVGLLAAGASKVIIAETEAAATEEPAAAEPAAAESTEEPEADDETATEEPADDLLAEAAEG